MCIRDSFPGVPVQPLLHLSVLASVCPAHFRPAARKGFRQDKDKAFCAIGQIFSAESLPILARLRVPLQIRGQPSRIPAGRFPRDRVSGESRELPGLGSGEHGTVPAPRICVPSSRLRGVARSVAESSDDSRIATRRMRVPLPDDLPDGGVTLRLWLSASAAGYSTVTSL